MCSNVPFANGFDLRGCLTGKRVFPAAVLVVDRCVWLILSASTWMELLYQAEILANYV